MTTFRIDLLHPGAFTKTWRDALVTPEAGKRLLLYYVGCVLVMFVVVGVVMAAKSAFQKDTKAIDELKQKIAQRQADLANQRSVYQGIVEMGSYEVVWSDVLVALSESMPPDLWLQSVEFADSTPGQQRLRLALVTPVRPGSGNLVEVDRFLNDLTQDPRFKKFHLQDWEVV
jgi:Tfp pilus assembly protein PilN